MSVESLAIVLHHSRATPTAKLVLVGIANHDGDGGAWPSVATLARYANITPRNVQKALASLEALGEIKRYVQQGGDWRTANARRPNRYEITLKCPWDCDRTQHHRTRSEALEDAQLDGLSTGASDSTPGVADDTRGVSDPTPKPSSKPSQNSAQNISRLPNAGARCSRGHRLIDDRHCEFGCPPIHAMEASA